MSSISLGNTLNPDFKLPTQHADKCLRGQLDKVWTEGFFGDSRVHPLHLKQ